MPLGHGFGGDERARECDRSAEMLSSQPYVGTLVSKKDVRLDKKLQANQLLLVLLCCSMLYALRFHTPVRPANQPVPLVLHSVHLPASAASDQLLNCPLWVCSVDHRLAPWRYDVREARLSQEAATSVAASRRGLMTPKPFPRWKGGPQCRYVGTQLADMRAINALSILRRLLRHRLCWPNVHDAGLLLKHSAFGAQVAQVTRSEVRLRTRARRGEQTDAERRIRRLRRPARHRHRVDRRTTADEDPGVPCETHQWSESGNAPHAFED